ncbi:hypothetical protein X798_02168 [Onchocerca flexuosa]|uniref:Uncharacterized protein n=1 Tax=Onchocerca flexuosa TaxID=387005 RepID=A0A238C0V0_9BILA|nr:hypothetical protein X798_02168 [Onchocerca flexuosa]
MFRSQQCQNDDASYSDAKIIPGLDVKEEKRDVLDEFCDLYIWTNECHLHVDMYSKVLKVVGGYDSR